MAYYIVPPNGEPCQNPAVSLKRHPNLAGVSNPTVIPTSLLTLFHWTFLIRHPRKAVPSYYRCTIPPQSEKTGFTEFMPSEAGYLELRRLFEFLHKAGIIIAHDETEEERKEQEDTYQQMKQIAVETWQENGETKLAKQLEEKGDPVNITVIDADDLLDDPEGTLKAYCEAIGLDFDPKMLKWDDEESQKTAKAAFEKWHGFHDDALDSTSLKPREHKAVSFVCIVFSDTLLNAVLTGYETEDPNQRGRRRGMEEKVRRRGTEDYQGDGRQERGRL